MSNVKSTGTTIISCPFDEGLIIATDTQATDTQSFVPYYTPSKTDSYLFLDVEDGVEISVSGAGLSNGTSIVATYALRLIKQTLGLYNITIADLKTPQQFLDFFNQACGIHVIQRLSALQMQVNERSVWLLGVKTPNFIIGFQTNFEGGSCFNVDVARKGRISNLCGIGSGARYILGAAFVADKQKKFETRTKDEVVNWLKTNFAQIVHRDIASSVQNGLHLTILYRNKKLQTLRA